jgi:glycosyltransferase involved in cell wall biosynthesis
VVHLLGSASVQGTAHVRLVAALARSLDPDRYRLRAWFLDDTGPLAETLTTAGVPARAVIFRGRTDLGGAMRLARALREDRPRLVHLHVGGRSRLWLLRELSSAKRVAHLHGDHADNGMPVPLESFVGTTHSAIATSRAIAAAAGDRATVIYPGVDITDAEASPRTRPPIIGAAGRLEPVKGLTFLLEAAAALRHRYPELQVQLVGSGTCEPRLRSLAARLGIAGSVSFLGWREDVHALYPRWRAFAQPSIHEGFGLAALEAMAAGVAVVASATGGLPELIEDERTGFLVPAGDVGALSERLGTLLEDNDLRSRMGEAARQRVSERFTVAEMAARTAEVYDRVLAE